MVDRAHQLGMKVLLDFVSQGCSLNARYLQEHPQWFERDEQGKMFASHDWNDTYSFDWANPEFQKFMIDFALQHVKKYDIDGFRIDAPHGKEPNWDRNLPYRASASSLGSGEMLKKLREELKKAKPDSILLCESYGPMFHRDHDMTYDYNAHHMFYRLLLRKITPQEMGTWLEDHFSSLPDGAIRVCFAETHDTRDVNWAAMALRGSLATQALMAIIVACGFVPMVYSGQEEGQREYYKRLFSLRHQLPPLVWGKRLFNPVSCSDSNLFSVIRKRGAESVLFIVNLSPHLKTFSCLLPLKKLGVEEESRYSVFEHLKGERAEMKGTKIFQGKELKEMKLTLIPFQPHFFTFDRLK